ncbi:MAG: site-2 protease family protein [Labilithrix sp.]|nr:site-2 protease family protein [Labilithrix sp.]MCW5814192.1 site-2 protease family protein [Labilithrix sp.]
MANLVLAIFGISLLMIVHEAGHYVFARLAGMRVTTFSIGFGPALWKHKPKGSPTTFQLCLVPFLAYVRIAGMGAVEEESDPKDPGLYENKSLRARALTILGGPLANYAFASVAIFALGLAGWPETQVTSPMIVDAVVEPAASAGVRAGDVVVEAAGTPVHDVRDLAKVTSTRAGIETPYVVERNGERLAPIVIVPREANGRGVIGISAKTTTTTRRLGVGEAAKLAVVMPAAVTAQNVAGFAHLAKTRSTEGVTGPVGMTKEVAAQVARGPYAFVLVLVAISIALGFFNLLPFPFLDGGRLMFLAFELIAGRRPNRTGEALVHAAGMLILLGIAALVTWRDITG